MRIIDEMRQMGHESLTAWVQRQLLKTAEELSHMRSASREGKRLQWKEAKLCMALARAAAPAYGGTLQGDLAMAVRKLFDGTARGVINRLNYTHWTMVAKYRNPW